MSAGRAHVAASAICHLFESTTSFSVYCVAAHKSLPAADGDIDILRINFQHARISPDAFSREHSGARARKRVEDDAMAPGAVLDGVGHHSDRLHGGVRAQV